MTPDLPLLTQVRYLALDEVFSYQEGERLPEPPIYKEDLLKHVNKRIREADKAAPPIAMRTLEKDIQDIQQIYGVRVKKLSRAKRAYYCYAEPGMQIRRSRLRAGEWTRLHRTLLALEEVAQTGAQPRLREAIAQLRWQFGTSQGQPRQNGGGWDLVANAGECFLEPVLEAIAMGSRVEAIWRDAAGKEQAMGGVPMLLREGTAGWMVWGMVVPTGTEAVAWGELSIWGMSLEDLVKWEKGESGIPIPREAYDALESEAKHRVLRRTFQGKMGEEKPEEIRVWFADDAFRDGWRLAGIQPMGKPELSAGGRIWSFRAVCDLALVRAVFAAAASGQILEPFHARDLAKQELAVLWKGYGKMFGP
jgi:hypothetical protein